MESKKVFSTKTGFCHIFPDKIVLTREGFIGGMANMTHENNIARLKTIYVIVLCCLLYLAIDNFKKGLMLPFVLIIVISLYIFIGLIRSTNISTAPIIPREKIVSVKFKPGFMRPCFDVRFKNEKGRIKKRIITLPGSLTGKKSETEQALNMMKEEGLLS